MAETIALRINVVENDQLIAHLRELGDQLVQHLPPTHLKFRFYLIDLPEVNAFSIAGGRIYVSRKIVAFARNDDEVAGILAHELGHIVTHQSAIEMTRAFRDVLGVTQVGNRDDIFRKYHQYVENFRRGKRNRNRQEEKHQIVADQVSIYALARAGFRVQALPDFWDRFNQLHGKAGSWFTDLFGSTTPEQHRLRDMVKNTASLPPGCADRPPSTEVSSFQAWQQAVVEYEGNTHSESLPGLISKHRLTMRLRSEVTNLRFSPDGKYLLAQDDGGIHILTRDPFSPRFYIPASDAREAQFSPDSASVVFETYGMRAESWSIAAQKRTSVHEITIHDACMQSQLSPDGKLLACMTEGGPLLLIDVTNSSVVYEKKDFYIPSLTEFFKLLIFVVAENPAEDNAEEEFHFANLKFSPDGHYFVASHMADFGRSASLLFDLTTRREASMPGSIRDAIEENFAFIAPDKIVGINRSSPGKSHILKLPSGERVGQVTLANGIHMRGATHGNFLIVGPMKEEPIGIISLDTGKFAAGIKQHTTDVWDGVIATERVNGELALHIGGTSDALATVQLQETRLGRLVVGAVSPDLNYLAVSTRSRGAVWDLSRDVRVFHARRFNGIGFAGNSAYAHFPKFQQWPASIGLLHVDTGAANEYREFKDEIVAQHGLYLVTTRPHKPGVASADADVRVEDIVSGQVLWSRFFAGSIPQMTFDSSSKAVLMRWAVASKGGEEELKSSPELKRSAGKEDLLCEVADASLGGLIASFIVKTNNGSVHYFRGSASREWVAMEATGDQLLTFALPSGEERGHFFGENATLSPSGMMAVNSAKREVTLYDLATSEVRQQYRFAESVSLKAFSEDGKRLLVFTNDQTVYVLDTASSLGAEPALASNPVN
ncbi:MAG TPA: M48 family metalloprotease [Terriglobales bacterium]